MPIGAAVGIAGAGLASGAMGASASKSAAKTVQQGTDRAADLEHQRWQQMLALQMPGYQRAEQAAGLYMSALGFPSMGGGQGFPAPTTTGQGFGGGLMTGGRANGAALASAKQLSDASYGAPEAMLYADDWSGPQISPGPTGSLPTASTGSGGPMDIPSMVRNQPGYQAQLDQGLKAIDRAAPLTGGMYSGRRMKALNEFGQQTFGSYYENWLNRVGGMAGQAPQIASNIGAQGQNSAATQAQLLMTGANARAQGTMNSANAWSGAIGDAVGAGMWLGGKKGWF